MSRTSKLRSLLTVGAVVSGIGVAAAQPSDAAQPQPALDLSASQLAQTEKNLSPEQMREQAAAFIPPMERSAAVVRRQLVESRQARDVVKVLCLNDKLNQIDVAVRSAQDRMTALAAAAGQGDQERTRHEYTVIAVLRDRVHALAAEANQCVGEETGFIGGSEVKVEIDPNIPDTETTDFPQETTVTELPPYVSPVD